MNTLKVFSRSVVDIPQITAWYLADIAEAKGKQDLYTRQSPQKLKTLKEHAMIESAVSSNRIEGVTVDRKRIGTILFGKPVFRDRDEEEVRGYREALTLIHTHGYRMSVSEKTIRQMHGMCRGAVGDAGEYKKRDSDIVENSLFFYSLLPIRIT